MPQSLHRVLQICNMLRLMLTGSRSAELVCTQRLSLPKPEVEHHPVCGEARHFPFYFLLSPSVCVQGTVAFLVTPLSRHASQYTGPQLQRAGAAGGPVQTSSQAA